MGCCGLDNDKGALKKMKHELSNANLVVMPDDPLSAATVKEAFEEMQRLFAEPAAFQSLTVDLSAVKIIDSLGVNLLVGLYKEASKQSKAFKVIHCAQPIRRLFDLYKLSGYFALDE